MSVIALDLTLDHGLLISIMAFGSEGKVSMIHFFIVHLVKPLKKHISTDRLTLHGTVKK